MFYCLPLSGGSGGGEEECGFSSLTDKEEGVRWCV